MRPVDASKKENESEVWENLFRDEEHAKNLINSESETL